MEAIGDMMIWCGLKQHGCMKGNVDSANACSQLVLDRTAQVGSQMTIWQDASSFVYHRIIIVNSVCRSRSHARVSGPTLMRPASDGGLMGSC